MNGVGHDGGVGDPSVGRLSDLEELKGCLFGEEAGARLRAAMEFRFRV